MSDFYDSPNDERSPSRARANGAKSPTRNGTLSKSIEEESERPGMERTDTTQSGWATENEDEKVSRHNIAD